MKEQEKIRIIIRESLNELHESGELELIEEGWLSRTAALLGITAASLFNVMGQSTDVSGLADKYDAATLNKIEQAMEDSTVQSKLKQLGVEDNNIEKAIKRLEDKKVDRMVTKTAANDADLARWLRSGYHISGVQTDTLIDTIKTVVPSAEVNQLELRYAGDNFFESGRFVLTQQSIDTIQKILNEIEASGRVLVNVTIESSTDKQGLSVNLQNKLESMGYNPNNQGLSQVRNDVVKQVLNKNGVDSSMIAQNVLFEQGSATVDDDARYVTVIFDVLDAAPSQEVQVNTEIVKTYPQTFELVKAMSKSKKGFKINLPNCKVKVNKYKKPKSKPWKCPTF